MLDFAKVEELTGKLKENEKERIELEQELASAIAFHPVKMAAAAKTKPARGAVGRPRGSGKAPNGHKTAPSGSREGSLKSLVTDILRHRKSGLKLADLTEAVLDKGYKTTASKPSTVVYQNIYKLLNEGVVKKTPDRSYVLA